MPHRPGRSPHPPFGLLWALAFELPLHWLAPPRCAACDVSIGGGVVFCAPCAATVVRLPIQTPACGPLAPFAYGGALAEAIRRFKYGGRADLSRPLASLLLGGLRGVVGMVDGVVGVPLHPRRCAERGFDQAALLVARLSRSLSCPYFAGAVRRVGHGPPQASLGREARLESPGLRFVADPRRLRGARVLLIDDVVTTGATLRACVQALSAAGVRSVTTACLARSDGGSAAP